MAVFGIEPYSYRSAGSMLRILKYPGRILTIIRQIFKVLKKTKLFRGLVMKLEDRAMRKSDQVKKYEFWGLMLFVGIPLPGTGAWTGSLIASLLEIDIKKSSLAIFCGIIMATVIMYIVSYGLVGNLVH